MAIAQYRAIKGTPHRAGSGKGAENAKGNNSQQGFTLDQRDFEEVCDMTRKFKQYLTDANAGKNQAMRAFQEHVRKLEDID